MPGNSLEGTTYCTNITSMDIPELAIRYWLDICATVGVFLVATSSTDLSALRTVTFSIYLLHTGCSHQCHRKGANHSMN